MILRQLRYVLHENHYLITDCKRRLIDIYGHKPGYEYDKLSKEVLERKCDHCDHLLSLQSVLSPGKSEFRGYLLMERHGAMLRLAQWDWLRMKVITSFIEPCQCQVSFIFQCTTLQYINTLTVCCDALREIIEILSPIRADSVEGANGLKVTDGGSDWFGHLHTTPGRKGGSSQQICRGVNGIFPSLFIIRSGTPNDRGQLLMVKFCVHNTQFGLLACGSSSWIYIFQFLDTRYRIHLANLDPRNGNQVHSYTHDT